MANNPWTVEYYETARGERVVEEEMAAFGQKVFVRILRTIDLLEEEGIGLGGGYIEHVKGKIWELKVSRYRVLYFTATGRRFVLLRAFIKQTRKTPPAEILIAEHRLDNYVTRLQPAGT